MNKEKNTFKEGVVKTGLITAAACVMCYVATIIPLILIGVRTVEIHVVGFAALMFLYPIIFTFLGVYLVMKKKFFPKMKEE